MRLEARIHRPPPTTALPESSTLVRRNYEGSDDERNLSAVIRQDGHAAVRWARAIVKATKSEIDPKTLLGWSRAAGAATGTLRSWCRAAGVSAKTSLDFARMLRAVLLSTDGHWDPLSVLDVVDERTLKRLAERSGLSMRGHEDAPTVRDFLMKQRFIMNGNNVRAVASLLLRQPLMRRRRSDSW